MKDEELREKAKEVMKRNKVLKRNFKIAVIVIIVLVLISATYGIARPRFNQYVADKQLEAAQQTVAIIIDSIRTNGFVQIGSGGDAMVLVEVQQ